MRTVIFICTGNSIRSQMAEALVNARLGATWVAFSAGTHPSGIVHPYALAALHEIGIEHRGRSKSVDEFDWMGFDRVITVCDSAAEECPLWLGPGKRSHHGYPDPIRPGSTPEETLNAFRAVRDAIETEIIPMLAEETISANEDES